ncbi:MAG: hypothetical protein ABI699_17840 [Caldimonas sp.]
MKLSRERIGTWVWVLIYGGLGTVGLGLALTRGGREYGWSLSVIGAVAVVVGALLVWLRSRMSDRAGP